MFSVHEGWVVDILGSTKKPLSIEDIATEFYGREVTLEDRNYIAGVIRKINRRCKEHRLLWFINGVGGGRGGRTVWKEKKNGSAKSKGSKRN